MAKYRNPYGDIDVRLEVIEVEREERAAIDHKRQEHAAVVYERREEREAIESEGGDAIDGLISADAILSTAWPEPRWAVPGLLPAGLTICGGRPKVGKSWLGLQLALAVAGGGQVLDTRAKEGRVLVLALEDPPRRLKERMDRQRWPRGLPVEVLPLGKFQEKVGDLGRGGAGRLADQMERGQYRLVVIDTFSRAFAGDQNDHVEMTTALSPIQEIAQTLNTAVLIIDHLRKGVGGDADAVVDLLGSTAKAALCDAVMGLYRERGKTAARLLVTGRDIEERSLALTMDWQTGLWRCEGRADALELAGRQAEIVAVIREMGNVGIMEISAAVGLNRGVVYRTCAELCETGVLVKGGTRSSGVRYTLADDPREEIEGDIDTGYGGYALKQ